MATSCEVRNPSKKCRNGTRPARVAAWEMQAKSWASWTELEASRANPGLAAGHHVGMIAEDRERHGSPAVRAATCIAKQVSSPAILYMVGIISRRPCDAVKVVARLPACNAPWTAPIAPPSDCISVTSGIVSQRFVGAARTTRRTTRPSARKA